MRKYFVFFIAILFFGVVSSPVLAASISGTVRDTTDQGLGLVNVVLTDPNGAQSIAVTDVDWKYAFSDLTVDGLYSLTVDKSGYTLFAPKRLYVNAGAAAEDVLLVIEENHAGGHVRDAAGEPIFDATVQVKDSGGTVVANPTINPAGDFSVKGLPYGAYSVFVTPTDGSSSVPTGRIIVNKNSYKTAEPIIGSATQIGGIVYDAEGRVGDGLVVTLTDATGEKQSNFTGPNGAYSFARIPEGQCNITVVSTNSSASENNITVSAGEQKSQNITLQEENVSNYRVTGTGPVGQGTLVHAITWAINEATPGIDILHIQFDMTGDPDGNNEYVFEVDSSLIVRNNDGKKIVIDGAVLNRQDDPSVVFRYKSGLGSDPIVNFFSDFVLKDIVIDGNNASATMVSVRPNISLAVFDSCTFKNRGSGYIQFRSWSPTILKSCEIEDVGIRADAQMFVRNCSFSYSLDATKSALTITDSSTASAVTDSSFTNIHSNPGVLTASIRSQARKTSIRNNTIKGSGVFFQNVDSGKIVSNTFSGCVGSAIRVIGGSGNVVAANTVVNSTGYGIAVGDGSTATSNTGIYKNVLRGNDRGINLDKTSTSALVSNRIIGSNTRGINADADTNLRLVENRVINGTGVGTLLKDQTNFKSTGNSNVNNTKGIVVDGGSGYSKGDLAVGNSDDGFQMDNDTRNLHFVDPLGRGNANYDLDINPSGVNPTITGGYFENSRITIWDKIQETNLGENSLAQGGVVGGLDAAYILVNSKKIKYIYTANEDVTVRLFLEPLLSDSEGRADAFGSLTFAETGTVGRSEDLVIGSDILNRDFLYCTETEAGILGEMVTISPSVLAPAILWGQEGQPSLGKQYFIANQWNEVDFRIVNAGNVADSYTVSPFVTTEDSGAWAEVGVVIDGESIAVGAAAYETPEIAAQSLAGGAGRTLNGRFRIKPRRTSKGAVIGLSVTSTKDQEEAISASFDADVSIFRQPQVRRMAPIRKNSREYRFYVDNEAVSQAVGFAVSSSEVATVFVYDLSGNMVLSQSFALGSDYTDVNTSTLGKGVYVWQMIINGTVTEQGKLAITD